VHIPVVLVKLNDSAKYVELSVECLRTRVRFPPPPPVFKNKALSAQAGGALFLNTC
jgi:hypothetical protein